MTLQVVTDSSHEKTILEGCIREKARPDAELRILEAGCGNKWQLSLKGLQYSLSGIDLDEDALRLRQARFKDLDEVIVGDLRTISLPRAQYDVIYTAYVLEHVSNVPLVLANFNRWLKPGGLMIIKVPDRDSVYGFIARNTPHWLHVYYYRFIKGNKNVTCIKVGFSFELFPVGFDKGSEVITPTSLQHCCKIKLQSFNQTAKFQ